MFSDARGPQPWDQAKYLLEVSLACSVRPICRVYWWCTAVRTGLVHVQYSNLFILLILNGGAYQQGGCAESVSKFPCIHGCDTYVSVLMSGIQSRDTVMCTQRGAAMQDVALLSGPGTRM